MEFRVWLVVAANGDDSRKLIGNLAEKYPISPQGVQNEKPVYHSVGNVTAIAFRVTVNGETQTEYNERFTVENEDEHEDIANETEKEGDALVATIKAMLKKLKIQWIAIAINEREGYCEFEAPDVPAVGKSRFSLMEETS